MRGSLPSVQFCGQWREVGVLRKGALPGAPQRQEGAETVWGTPALWTPQEGTAYSRCQGGAWALSPRPPPPVPSPSPRVPSEWGGPRPLCGVCTRVGPGLAASHG